MTLSYWIDMGQIMTSSVRPASKASTRYLRIPSLGDRSLPVRDREPSIKHSTVEKWDEWVPPHVQTFRKSWRTIHTLLQQLFNVFYAPKESAYEYRHCYRWKKKHLPRTTAGYSASSPKLLRIKNAPHFLNQFPRTGIFRFEPATMKGRDRPSR